MAHKKAPQRVPNTHGCVACCLRRKKCISMGASGCSACHQFLLKCIPKNGPIRSTSIRLKSKRRAAENEVRSAMRTRHLRKEIAMLPAAEELVTVNFHEGVEGGDGVAIHPEDRGGADPGFQLNETSLTNDVYARTQDCEPYDDSSLDVDLFLPGLKDIAQALSLKLVPNPPNVDYSYSPNPPFDAPLVHSIPFYRNVDHILYDVTLGVRTLAQHYGYYARPLHGAD